MSLAFYKLAAMILYMLGFVVFIIVLPLLIALILWVIGKINPNWATISKKKRWRIAYIPNIVIYLLFVGYIWSGEYVATGIRSLGDAYELSLPYNIAYDINYPREWLGGDDFGKIKQVKFLWKISDEAIARMDALCEQTKEMEASTEGVICHYPEYNNIQKEQMGFNPKGYPRGWSKEDGSYYYCAESGSGCYYFAIDPSTNSAVTQYYKW